MHLNNLKVFIPTKGRAVLQRTYEGLPPEVKKNTMLVIDKNDVDGYIKAHIPEEAILTVPKSIKGICPTRQFIMEYCYSNHIDFMCMLDDDITFQKRNLKGKILNATSGQVLRAFENLLNNLTEYVHAGIATRSMDYDNPKHFKVNGRMMHVLGYCIPKVFELECYFTKDVAKNFSMDDFHMTLQLLEKGASNIIDLNNRISPSSSNSKGGASLWRTLESHNSSAKQLERNHPKFVKVKVKHGWQGMEGERLDVIVQWKKAYESFKENSQWK